MCPRHSMCCGASETADHVFLFYPTLVSLWSLVRLQIGVASVDPNQLQDHFVHSSSGIRVCRSFMQLL
ncbi:hypothetical protein MtrunA17_Chr5g0395511 [Medicago truncatula]|uniref:Uncharacterized protein n=1 Tax=Medicago truncatula TaxID=3880 RepID=A0A396HNF9_MEDTR|nr:hypothetical protein MtrunA17_Chr5g0395511 [Medicago truncatula]